ncbi:glycosyltransferase [Paenibacillus septentrionalis]|uniref:Glycosyltransferase n=1 Tax=Paenibacillus septentrionalis TaxID=429342 RepID=A0ABW1VAK2_9BACL
MKVTALLSTFNNEKYINQTIDSVLSQSYEDFEFIIVNDGSTDATKELIQQYKDDRIRLINLPDNVGIARALNMGIQYCQGKYVIKIDGDDIQHPDRFYHQIKFMEENPELSLSKCKFEYFPDNKEIENSLRFANLIRYNQFHKNFPSDSQEISKWIKLYCCIVHSAMIIKTDVLKRYMYRDFVVGEDYDLFLRLDQEGHLMGHLEECLLRVRVSDRSITANFSADFFNIIGYQIKQPALEKFKQNQNIYIWGTGNYGRELINLLESKDWKIDGFIDSFIKEDTKLNDKPIINPEMLRNQNQIKIIIASSTGFFEIIDFLENIGYVSGEDFTMIR